ncbi:MAG: hypothetical protein MHM6MM_002809 [Cercozoa sp. M6MM]
MSLLEAKDLLHMRLRQHMKRSKADIERTVWTYWEGDMLAESVERTQLHSRGIERDAFTK